jgi:hypothetical protein
MASSESFFRRLTRLFRSGPAIRRRIKGYDYKAFYDKDVINQNYGYGPFPFKREQNPFSVLGAYGLLDRMSRYSEFSEMEYTGEIATALNVYADESCSGDDKGKCFHIYSDNPDIRKALEELFYDVVNIEFNLRPWVRNLVKYGDFFLYNEVAPDIGVVNVVPIPVNEMEREEGFDNEDPYAVRFKWIARGQKTMENWQVTHIRLLGNDLFLPYGTSLLESARKVWRQLTMIEDAMLTYRIVRSPERRVFYVDVSNVAPNDIPNYMEQVKASMRSNTAVDRTNGRLDYRYNPVAIDEDYFIPVRGDRQATKIETLAGGQHVSAVEDVQYILKKLVSALMIPAAYLGYDESLSSKATLAQEDIRFSRTINIIQKAVLAELNKLAILHLYAKGFDGEDLIDFELRLSNPSSVAMQQKLQLWKTRFEIADNAKSTELVDWDFIRREILGFTAEEIKKIDQGVERDKIRALALDDMKLPEEAPSNETDPFDPSNYTSLPGKDAIGGSAFSNNDNGGGNSFNFDSGPRFNQSEEDDAILLPGGSNVNKVDVDNKAAPIKPSHYVQRRRRQNARARTDGARSTAMPDLAAMLNPIKNQSLKDIYDSEFLDNPLAEDFDVQLKIQLKSRKTLTAELKSIIHRFESATTRMNSKVITEGKIEEIHNEEPEEEMEKTSLEEFGINLKQS